MRKVRNRKPLIHMKLRRKKQQQRLTMRKNLSCCHVMNMRFNKRHLIFRQITERAIISHMSRFKDVRIRGCSGKLITPCGKMPAGYLTAHNQIYIYMSFGMTMTLIRLREYISINSIFLLFTKERRIGVCLGRLCMLLQ